MLHLVQLDDFTTTTTSTAANDNKTHTPLIIHPDWLLSAWSVDRNGTVPPTRPIARSLPATLRDYYADPTSDLHTLQLFLYHIYTLGQALSLIPYSYTLPPPPPSSSSSSSTTPYSNPTLTTSAQLHVWAWSLSARTSKLGVVIACAGCVCVVARLALGVLHKGREHSAVEVLMAIERDGDGVGMEEGEREREMARLRCRVREDGGGGGGRRARFVVEGRREGGGIEG